VRAAYAAGPDRAAAGQLAGGDADDWDFDAAARALQARLFDLSSLQLGSGASARRRATPRPNTAQLSSWVRTQTAAVRPCTRQAFAPVPQFLPRAVPAAGPTSATLARPS
jgi:hypothetical protein